MFFIFVQQYHPKILSMRKYMAMWLVSITMLLVFSASSCKPEEVEPDPEPPPVEVPEDPEDGPYEPGDPSGFEQDTKISPAEAWASENQPGEDISKALDGNFNTIYHSLWNQSKFPSEPVIIEFYFEDNAGTIDYMLYHPRKDGGNNGHILECELWIMKDGATDYEKVSDHSFSGSSATRRLEFPEDTHSPQAARLVVTKGQNDYVSASQFEFYKRSNQMEGYAELFTDLSFSALKDGVSREDLEAIDNDFIRTLGLAIYDDIYEKERIGTYSTYPDPSIISAQNKTNRMGPYDNVTGIHVKWGERLIVFVDETVADMSLRIVNHFDGYGGQDFLLDPGINSIISPASGLVYIIYNTDIPHKAKVNIASGSINGYFDIEKHDHSDWERLIAGADYAFFDIKGTKSLLTFTTQELRQHVSDAPRLVEVYDSIVTLQQQLMGLYKYDRVPQGRLYYRTNTRQGVYMHATGNATEYAPGTLENLANHQRLRSQAIWGPAHETGHIHQTRPGLMWAGLTEVTVNIYSQHVQTTFGNPSRLETENISGYNNRYEKAFSDIIAAGLPHGASNDVFCKLVPFWQLQLYFAKVLGNEDFYKDVHEHIRTNPNPPTHGLSQLEFVKTVSHVAGRDMRPFFQAWGFLTPIDQDINDYGVKRMTVSEEQIQDVEDYLNAQGYGTISAPIHYITDGNLNIFMNNQSVRTGQASRNGNQISMTGWENVVAYEVYYNDALRFVSPFASFTIPPLPESIEVFAVGPRGTRHKVNLQQ